MNRTLHQSAGSSRFLPWMLPLMLALVAITALLSGRDLSQAFLELARGSGSQHPAVPWIQRVISLALVFISLERLFRHYSAGGRLRVPVLTAAFVIYWLGTVASPAFFGAHRQLSHEYLYGLIFGLAALVSTGADLERVLAAARTALLVFLLAGAVVAVVDPPLALDTHYTQGLFSGVPRFGGLATYPVAMGMFAQIFLLCLWVRPFPSRTLNVFAWMVGLSALFFAQSKTAWIAFVLCSITLVSVRVGGKVWRRMGDPREATFGVAMSIVGFVVVAAVLAVLVFGNIGSEASGFLETPEGEQLMTLTGRDQIWAIAWDEWHASPVFGYGLGLWDDAFRAAINMPNATNAHNQFMDTLARSGVVGATALVLYSIVLLVYSVRAAKVTGGLSIALFIALALRSISEVPLVIFSYGSELFAHLLLIITLASASAAQPLAARAASRQQGFRTAT